MPRQGHRFWRFVLMGFLALGIAACGGTQSKVICPINYDASGAAECFVGTVNDSVTQQEMDAVQLQQNQIGIFQPPGKAGDRPVKIVEGIGAHSVPARYTIILPTNSRTYKTDRNYNNPDKCPAEFAQMGECDSTLDSILLKDGVSATADIEIDYQLNISQATADQFVKLGSYQGFMSVLKSHVRDSFRNASSVSKDEYEKGTFKRSLHDLWWTQLTDKNWKYATLVVFTDLRLRSAEPVGIDAQGSQKAQAYATQVAIACPPNVYTDQNARVECEKAFIWSQKTDSSQPPPAAPVQSQTPPAGR